MLRFIISFRLVLFLIGCQATSTMETYTYLALGDSYTIGESVPVEYSFPYQINDRLQANGLGMEKPVIIARTGWTTDELQAGIRRETLTPPFDIVTLLIGVNNQYRGREMDNYFTYWLTTYFDGKIYAGYLWFLSTLLIIMLLLCLAYRLSPRLQDYFRSGGPHAPSARLLQPGRLLLLALGVGLCMLCINLVVPDGYWARIGQKGIIIFQPTRLPQYIGFFIWGCIACKARWRYMHDPDPWQRLAGWAAGAFCCVGAYLALLQNYYMWLERSVLLTAALCLLRAFGPLCMTMLLIGLFKAWVHRQARWKDLLAANAYGMYVAHIPFVVVAQYVLMGSPMTGAAKFGLIAALSLPLSFMCSHFVLRRLPRIGRFF